MLLPVANLTYFLLSVRLAIKFLLNRKEMKKVESVGSFDKIKLLADSRRMDILRLLMACPATLTQLARIMHQSPAWVRHHILALEQAELVEVGEVRKTGKVIEKYYRARVDALLLQELILPKSKKKSVIFSGSHDLALEEITAHLSRHVHLLNLSVGSLDGLVNLRQGLCQVSGSHIRDQNGEYNTTTVRHLFPDREVEIITLAHRTQGLMLSAGNPIGIKKIADIANPKVRFVNRNPGSGTRLWIDAELHKLRIPVEKVNGYERVVMTHSEAASLIEGGEADAGIGLQAAARQHDLDFLPLFEERYDLVLPRANEKALSPLLDYLQTLEFRRSAEALSGYTTAHSGEQVFLHAT